jgi:hypothetical protein
VERLLDDVPVDFACELVRALAPFLGEIAAKETQPILGSASQSTKKQQCPARRRKARAAALRHRERLQV